MFLKPHSAYVPWKGFFQIFFWGFFCSFLTFFSLKCNYIAIVQSPNEDIVLECLRSGDNVCDRKWLKLQTCRKLQQCATQTLLQSARRALPGWSITPPTYDLGNIVFATDPSCKTCLMPIDVQNKHFLNLKSTITWIEKTSIKRRSKGDQLTTPSFPIKNSFLFGQLIF